MEWGFRRRAGVVVVLLVASQVTSGDVGSLRPSVAMRETRTLARSAAGCSGYYSDVTPPPTINVYYNGFYGDGLVHTYDFMSYVKNVLPNEWYPSFDRKSLQAGAMWVRNYGWYKVNHSAHNTVNGQCYDVDATTGYQLFRAGSETSATNDAVASIWYGGRIYRRPSSGLDVVNQTYYKAGYTSDTCGQLNGSAAPGHDGSQFGSQNCAARGLPWSQITRTYYFQNSNPIDPAERGVITLLDDSQALTENIYPGGGPYQINGFALDRSGNVWTNWFVVGASWGGWNVNLGGGCSSAPGASGDPNSNIWLFCRKLDSSGYVQASRWNGSSWGGWFDLDHGGFIESAPAATEYFINSHWQINVYGLGWDGNIFEISYNETTGTWSSWHSLGSPGGGCTSGPGADWRVTNDLDVFCRGADGAEWYTWFNGTAWQPWTSLGGLVYSAAGVTDEDTSRGWHLKIFVDGQLPGNIFQNDRQPDQSWSGFNMYFGGVCESAADATDFDATADIWMGCRGSDDNLWFEHFDGTNWSGWISQGRP